MGISMYIYIYGLNGLHVGLGIDVYLYIWNNYIYNTYINIGLTEMLVEQNYIHQFTVSLCSA